MLTSDEKQRWKNIKATFVKNNKLKGLGGTSEIAQVLEQMMQFSENLEGIQEVLRKGFSPLPSATLFSTRDALEAGGFSERYKAAIDMGLMFEILHNQLPLQPLLLHRPDW